MAMKKILLLEDLKINNTPLLNYITYEDMDFSDDINKIISDSVELLKYQGLSIKSIENIKPSLIALIGSKQQEILSI